jgi:hypothetical protein
MTKKSQHQIRFENLFLRSLSGWWSSYAPQTVGNIIHWVYVFSESLDAAEQITVGSNEVHLYGKLMARIEIDEALQMPIFVDIDYYNHFEQNQKIFHEGLRMYKDFIREWSERYKKIRPISNIQNKRYSLKEKFYIAKQKDNDR